MPGTKVPCEALEFRPGDALVFYTDGVTEAFNTEGEQFGERRLLEHLAKVTGQPADQTVGGTFAAVRAFAGNRSQSDDITILAVRALP